MMWNKNRIPFLSCDKEYQEASIVLFGAPFDGTTSYRPGTRFGSSAIRAESFGIETYSPYQEKDLEELAIFDGGDLELPFGSPSRVLERIEEATESILKDCKIPCLLGGEHLVTLGAVRAVRKHFPDLEIIQFDAHADLRDEYLEESLSHACVMRRIWELVGDGRIHQFGIRSGQKQEFEFAKEHTCLQKFHVDGFLEYCKKLEGKPVYVTLDLDVLDSSVFPGTGTPEAGGIFFQEFVNALIACSNLNVVGCDVTELSPQYDLSGASTAVACKTVRELLLAIGGN